MGASITGVGAVVTVTGVLAATTTTDATSVATDQPISGFTVGAAVVAVLIGGLYWYYRHGGPRSLGGP